jgi:hypothetical protein
MFRIARRWGWEEAGSLVSMAGRPGLGLKKIGVGRESASEGFPVSLNKLNVPSTR